jgi:hypothetical protein
MSSRNGSAPDPQPMAPRTAIFYAEHPLALLRDFETELDQSAALRNVERGLARARGNDPLAFRAYRVRQAARARRHVGVGEGAARFLAWRRASGVMPDCPNLRTSLAGARRLQGSRGAR